VFVELSVCAACCVCHCDCVCVCVCVAAIIGFPGIGKPESREPERGKPVCVCRAFLCALMNIILFICELISSPFLSLYWGCWRGVFVVGKPS
jgi:hypothetical protein